MQCCRMLLELMKHCLLSSTSNGTPLQKVGSMGQNYVGKWHEDTILERPTHERPLHLPALILN